MAKLFKFPYLSYHMLRHFFQIQGHFALGFRTRLGHGGIVGDNEDGYVIRYPIFHCIIAYSNRGDIYLHTNPYVWSMGNFKRPALERYNAYLPSGWSIKKLWGTWYLVGKGCNSRRYRAYRFGLDSNDKLIILSSGVVINYYGEAVVGYDVRSLR